MEIGTIAAIWRYPVKALAAERLHEAHILADGLDGDRTAALVVETPSHARAGKPFRGKESNRLHLTADPETAASYAADDGVTVSLDRTQGRYFDAAPVSLLFDLWVADVEALTGTSLDPLRFRPNIFVSAARGFTAREADLTGAVLRAGSVVLRVAGPTERCITPNFDIATGAPGPDVLRAVAQHRAAWVGVYCDVVEPGTIEVGDALRRSER